MKTFTFTAPIEGLYSFEGENLKIAILSDRIAQIAYIGNRALVHLYDNETVQFIEGIPTRGGMFDATNDEEHSSRVIEFIKTNNKPATSIKK